MTLSIIKNLPFQIDLFKLTKDLQIPLAPELQTELEQLTQEAYILGHPKAIYRQSAVQEKGDNFVIIDGITFNSRILRVNLDREFTVYPFVVTSGVELEEWYQV